MLFFSKTKEELDMLDRLRKENDSLRKDHDTLTAKLKENEELIKNYRELKLSGLTIQEWCKERADTEEEYHHKNNDMLILDAKNKMREEFRLSSEKQSAENLALKIENASLKVRVEMLEKATEVSGDILDVKDLVNKLVEKMPEIKLSTLSVNIADKESKKE